ncbi:hypothetical protein RHMOL_Rhmol01G0127600 [Rhododendron molle]|uniref:Uncharacterized protein n=1 Tax=Rhododendron molle TaxID=49168 RepID=A0ACC0Q1E5_RHOML|nr:hypothetical protein RHMOL_Rhmol01G0127600 [Rhododendron molle]
MLKKMEVVVTGKLGSDLNLGQEHQIVDARILRAALVVLLQVPNRALICSPSANLKGPDGKPDRAISITSSVGFAWLKYQPDK